MVTGSSRNVSTEDTQEILDGHKIVSVSSNLTTWVALETGDSTSIWFGDLNNDSEQLNYYPRSFNGSRLGIKAG